jgi:hypothetical protein
MLGQEGATKSLTMGSCSNGSSSGNIASGTSGKLKRVRTIFTAEQLERLEGEFARQQYMVSKDFYILWILISASITYHKYNYFNRPLINY